MPEGVNVTLARTKIAEMGKLNIPCVRLSRLL